MYQAIAQAKPEYLEQSERSGQKQTRKAVWRGVLIAAAIAAIGCTTALAVTFSLRDAARTDMGLSGENLIPEWTEYEGLQRAEAEPEQEKAPAIQAALASTMCSGQQLYAYLEVSPVSAEIAQACSVPGAAGSWYWDIGGISPREYDHSYWVEQTAYDAETQTALVKVGLIGELVERSEQIELKLFLRYADENRARCGPIVIPITQAQMLSCPADVTVRNVKAHLDLDPDDLNADELPDYVAEGRIGRITICAGYLEVELETPSLDQWGALTGLDQSLERIKPTISPGLAQMLEETGHDPEEWVKESFRERCFRSSWERSVNEALAGAELHDKDGTSRIIDEIPSAYGGVWLFGSGAVPESVYEGKDVYRFTPQKPFDLSAVRSITVGGTEYFFPTGE